MDHRWTHELIRSSRRVTQQVSDQDLFHHLDPHYGCPVKLGKVSVHSVRCQVDRRAKLMSLKGLELDNFKDQSFKLSNFFTFPHFLTSQNHACTMFSHIFVFLLFRSRQLRVRS